MQERFRSSKLKSTSLTKSFVEKETNSEIDETSSTNHISDFRFFGSDWIKN